MIVPTHFLICYYTEIITLEGVELFLHCKGKMHWNVNGRRKCTLQQNLCISEEELKELSGTDWQKANQTGVTHF